MSGRPDAIESLLIQRLELVGKLSQATAEHMRILQMSRGIDVLLMKQPESPETCQNRSETDNSIADSQAAIDSLESSLAVIDKSIESIMNTEV